jgi:predicted PurR-regulated permease PerM
MGRGFGAFGVSPAAVRGKHPLMQETVRRAFLVSLVVIGVVVAALALWELRLLIALLFLAFIVAAAMRPGVDWLNRRRVPRGVGVAIHYLALAGFVALLLWLVVPRAIDQVRLAIGDTDLNTAAKRETGWKHDALVALDSWLNDLPPARNLVDPALHATVLGLEILVGIFFVLASAAYWIFERERAVRIVTSVLPRPKRKVVRDTWDLIDLKLGAYVRGQLILIVAVATVLSLAFGAIGLPFWLLVGVFAGVVEIVPVIGPLTAGGLAVGVGLTESWQLALAAGLIVLAVRLVEDYLVIPKVLGDAVGLSPLLVLVSVTATALLFGGFAVLLAIPLAAVLATLVSVIVLDRDPAKEDVPAVLFPAKDAEA